MDLAIENLTNTIETNFTPNTAESNEKLRDALAEFVKAFGDCKKCYGKGYSMDWFSGQRITDDNKGEPKPHTPKELKVLFCDCGRGKQAKELFVPKYDEPVNT